MAFCANLYLRQFRVVYFSATRNCILTFTCEATSCNYPGEGESAASMENWLVGSVLELRKCFADQIRSEEETQHIRKTTCETTGNRKGCQSCVSQILYMHKYFETGNIVWSGSVGLKYVQLQRRSEALQCAEISTRVYGRRPMVTIRDQWRSNKENLR